MFAPQIRSGVRFQSMKHCSCGKTLPCFFLVYNREKWAGCENIHYLIYLWTFLLIINWQEGGCNGVC